MKSGKWNLFAGSFYGAAAITVIIMAASFLSMLFASGEDGRRETLFHTLYVESTTSAEGAVRISFGLTQNYLPIILLFASTFLVILGVSILHHVVRRQRERRSKG